MKKLSRWLFPLVILLVLVVGGGYAVLRLAPKEQERTGPRRADSTPDIGRLISGPPELEARPGGALGEAVRYAGRRPTAAELRAAVEGANVVICVLDAARYDHFGYHGYPRETTPNFDRLARESLVFDRHFCQYTATTGSTTSLLTSQYPATHGISLMIASNPTLQFTGYGKTPTVNRSGRPGAGRHRSKASGEAKGLVGRLSEAGFQNLFISSIGTAFPVMGLEEDFDFSYSPQRHNPDPEGLVSMLEEELRKREGQRFFAYLHFVPPHAPYGAPEDMKQLFLGKKAPNHRLGRPAFEEAVEQEGVLTEESVNLYDANLRWADWGLGKLEEMLRELGVFDKTVLIVTADHGEGMGEHGYKFHTRCPYDEVAHVPLMMRLPGQGVPAGRVGALTQTIDVMPTVLDLLSVSAEGALMQGRSLVPVLAGEAGEVNRYAFTATGGPMECYVVRDLEWALLLYEGGKLRALYDLKSDPGQTRNVAEEHPEQVERLSKVFEVFARSQPTQPLEFLGIGQVKPVKESVPQELPPEVEEELRALGYVK